MSPASISPLSERLKAACFRPWPSGSASPTDAISSGSSSPDDVAAAFRSTDFFIFPSRYETSGLVLLEAAATGLPVITARSVGGAGIFAPDGALIADDPEDVVWLTNAMIRLRDDPQLAADLARAAQAIAERQTWAAATARYLDLFERLADSHSH